MCRAAALRFELRFVVIDVRGLITTQRAGAAGYSIFAIAQWRLERNYLPTRHFPLPPELEQMQRASDNWAPGCVHTVCEGGGHYAYVNEMIGRSVAQSVCLISLPAHT